MINTDNTNTDTRHKAEWMRRYATDYPNNDDREQAYAQHQETLAAMRAVFAP